MSVHPTFHTCFNDKRLNERAIKLLRDLFSKSVHSIRQLAVNAADLKAWYRFLHNDKTKEELLVKEMTDRCGSAVKGKIVLSIQDTSEMNFYRHKNRIKKDEAIGQTNASAGGLGFMIHPSLVVDALTCFPYGFSDVAIWNRPLEKNTKHERKYQSLPIEEKESYKWLKASQNTKECLKEAECVIIIQDREGDIYQQFATIPDAKTHLLIRAKTNRSLHDGGKLFDQLRSGEPAGQYRVKVDGDKRRKQTKREAILDVRYSAVIITKPRSEKRDMAASVPLYAVEAKEVNPNVKNPINWRILTTYPVSDLDSALLIIEWYKWRWMIEEVFRILKKEGFNIEASELESAKAIRKLCMLMLNTIMLLFQMRACYEQPEEEGLPADFCFNQAETECLKEQIAILEGKTQKQKNHHPQNSLRWATWAIARLGGWKGYASERQPGITTLWIGLRRFHDIHAGWQHAINVSTR